MKRTVEAALSTPGTRLYSLDALRGFDMFWIMGAEEIFHSLDDYRFCSVLARIGLAYMFANIIYLYSRQTTQMIWFSVLLIAYWLLLKFNSAPGFAPGDLSMEGNFASYIDRSVLPSSLYLKIHDPEGLLSLIPAISTALLGILTGSLLKNSTKTEIEKVLFMAVSTNR